MMKIVFVRLWSKSQRIRDLEIIESELYIFKKTLNEIRSFQIDPVNELESQLIANHRNESSIESNKVHKGVLRKP